LKVQVFRSSDFDHFSARSPSSSLEPYSMSLPVFGATSRLDVQRRRVGGRRGVQDAAVLGRPGVLDDLAFPGGGSAGAAGGGQGEAGSGHDRTGGL
jgi:hypothetical protein